MKIGGVSQRMADCRYLDAKDVTSFGADIFGHPEYEYICRETGREVIPCLHCNPARCENYDATINDEE